MNTFGLSMIVAAGESELLDRCLTTYRAKEVFDEIAIINTSNDDRIDEIAIKHGAMVEKLPWCSERYPYGNFARARNASMLMLSTDYWMWLDSDDVLQEQHQKAFDNTVSVVKDDKNNSIDMYMVSYAILVGVDGTPITTFWRERIFKRSVGFEWHYPVHETVFPDSDQVKSARLNGMYVTHRPNKPAFASATRNVDILRHEVNLGTADTHLMYFYARDLLLTGAVEESEKTFCKMLDNVQAMSKEMAFACCMEMVWFHGYRGYASKPKVNELRICDAHKIESWLRRALTYSNVYAEPYVILGDLYFMTGRQEAAERMWQTAFKKEFGKGKIQNALYYVEIPASRLYKYKAGKGDFDAALTYNSAAINSNMAKEYVVERKAILQAALKQVDGVLNGIGA